jgi:hypothetical protein
LAARRSSASDHQDALAGVGWCGVFSPQATLAAGFAGDNGVVSAAQARNREVTIRISLRRGNPVTGCPNRYGQLCNGMTVGCKDLTLQDATRGQGHITDGRLRSSILRKWRLCLIGACGGCLRQQQSDARQSYCGELDARKDFHFAAPHRFRVAAKSGDLPLASWANEAPGAPLDQTWLGTSRLHDAVDDETLHDWFRRLVSRVIKNPKAMGKVAVFAASFQPLGLVMGPGERTRAAHPEQRSAD